jgi:hypothetical protein
MCIYGIELLADNIAECRANMLDLRRLPEPRGVGRPVPGRVLRAVAEPRPWRRPDDARRRNSRSPLPNGAIWARASSSGATFRLDVLTQGVGIQPRGQSLFSANLGKHEIFTPTRTYPPMTVRELARVCLRPEEQSYERPSQLSPCGRNPDVLTCIANLSNDEVFTPPEFANRMLDTLGRGLGRQPRRGEHLGRQDGEVPRPLHQIRRVPARDHQPPYQGAGEGDSGIWKSA